MKVTVQKITILISMITFILLSTISQSVFASDKYPNFESPEECIAQAKKERTLYIYDWADWWPEELYTGFEKKYGIKIVRDNFSTSDEMLTKFRLNPELKYDVVMSGLIDFIKLKKFGALKKLNHDWVPNIGNYIGDDFINTEYDPDFEYLAPYCLYLSGIAYNSNVVDPNTKDLDSWKIVFEKNKYARRMTQIDDSYTAIGSALIYLGYSPNSDDEKEMAAAKELLLKQKPNLIAYDAYPNRLFAEKEIDLAVMWAGDIYFAAADIPGLKLKLPKEGTMKGYESILIPKGGKSPAAAHLFLNWIWNPENNTKLIEGIGYTPTHKATPHMLSEEVKAFPSMFPSSEYLDKCVLVEEKAAVGKGSSLRAKVWEEIKN